MQTCTACAEHQNKLAKLVIHTWMMSEKRQSLFFFFFYWPCGKLHRNKLASCGRCLLHLPIHPSNNQQINKGYNLHVWRVSRKGLSWGITHLTGLSYHPATNGQAEHLVQTFKQSLRKSSLPPKAALQEFFIQYCCTPQDCGLSPSELLNRRQITVRVSWVHWYHFQPTSHKANNAEKEQGSRDKTPYPVPPSHLDLHVVRNTVYPSRPRNLDGYLLPLAKQEVHVVLKSESSTGTCIAETHRSTTTMLHL